ncbi:Cys-Gly metallodipeptidase [Komagataella phaffii CBS 7435]|uniref:Cys-Gly metallodipeptidase DUG1 n=2 Tax=Komagataella phaffii TaxID=460519 RepID=C4QVB5_KOMPG|nr:putative di-and tri-peptidase [Komagataella phaffii GS115]CAH2445843.1 Cys-Gly metallodipeptidase [Komagataella phaffii CBS 7435]CAY67188.1 Probable di-and tri-peptidase [Komagataella phaffii GS115]SCV11760.1 Cys-Gly metallodipeptidase [Komagataella phaffii CBS 7435]
MNFTRLLSTINYKKIPPSIFRSYSTMSIEKKLQSVFSKVDELKPVFIERLANAVAIPSVSGDESLRKEVFKMSEFLVKELESLGAYDIQVKPLGKQPPPVTDENLELPPIVLARVGKDETKKTIMIYGHYDVQPALKDDGWDTYPFKLVEVNDKLYGRGSTDDKGPVIAWLNVLQAHKELSLELPVNIIFCFEGMEESGSLGLEELVGREADKYFKGVDTCCISDNYWLGTKKPVLTYGLRGCNYYQIIVSGPGADLHSGIFGGVIHEPMTDLIRVMSQLVDVKGKILIPGIDEMVAPVTETEEKLYDDIEFDVNELNAASGSNTAIYQSKNDILMHRWRYPSLSLHGIEGAFSGGGAKTVIPAKVIGKFSIRTVPDIDSKKMDQYVFDYVNAKFKELGTPNSYKVELIHDGAYWKSDPFNDSFTAAKKATKVVWGVEPDLTREGGSIPITLTFEQQLKTNVLLLPLGKGDDGAHSINEKIDVKNYIEGAKTMAAYLHYYGEI